MNNSLRSVLVVVCVLLAGGVGYLIGFRQAEGRVRGLVLAQSLKDIAICANGLHVADSGSRERVMKLLDQQLRLALDAAEANAQAGQKYRGQLGNLLEGVKRAEKWAQTKNDAQLAARLGALSLKLSQ